MNHYERLKVTQDAPPEVIRAAYRALANRLHPDRNGGAGGADDASHDQMAELNAAYEVLIDPVLRRDYDATLEPVRAAVARAVDPGPLDRRPRRHRAERAARSGHWLLGHAFPDARDGDLDLLSVLRGAL